MKLITISPRIPACIPNRLSGRQLLAPVHHHDRDVVMATSLVSRIDQGIAGRQQVDFRAEQLRSMLICQQARQAIST
jgi:hypothetical protein